MVDNKIPAPAPPRPGLDRDPRWQAVQRIVSSRSFSRAARLSGFLTYVAERALAGCPEDVTEQQVGMRVFSRPAGYNPSEDNIVRSTARQLRERLAVYYQEEGAADELRVILPRGGYLPHFEKATAVTVEPDPPVAEPLPPATALPSYRWEWLRLAAVAAATAVALLTFQHVRQENRPSLLWRTIFDGKRAAILVPGDSGTVMFQNLTGTAVHVSDYATGAFRSAPPALLKADESVVQDIGGRRYTSFSDLKFASRLSATPGFQPDKFDIRFARDLHVDDLKSSNLVLVGAPQGNPWVELFDNNLNFRIVSDEVSRSLTVVNRAPLAGESEKYTYSAYDPSHRAYALISLTHNLDNSGVALLVEGTTVAGIDAATEFLFNDRTMGPILKEAAGPNGRMKGFEILLETANVANSGVSAVVRAKRFRTI
jgi:hypothetical protein